MDIKKLQRVVVDALEDVKAQNIKVFNTVGLSDMFDRVVLASGSSNRQTRALAWRVAQQVKEAGGHVVSVEGAEAGEWVLVDLGDMVVHVMQPAIRDYYGLEEIWGGKPVRVKTFEPATTARRIAAHASGDGQDTTLAAAPEVAAPVVVTAAPAADVEADAPPAAKPVQKRPRATAPKKMSKSAVKSATKTTPKSSAKSPAKTAPKKAAARYPAATKRAAAPKAVAKKAAVKKPAAKKPAAKKNAPKKAAVKKAAVKKVAAQKPASKKAAARKPAARKKSKA